MDTKEFSVDIDEGGKPLVAINYTGGTVTITLDEAREICSALHRYDWAQAHEEETAAIRIDPLILCANCDEPMEVETLSHKGTTFYAWIHGLKSNVHYSTCGVYNHGKSGVDQEMCDKFLQATHPNGVTASEWVERTH
jgi:hypothetical protein